MIAAVDIGATKTLVAQFSNSLQPVSELRFETQKNQVEFYNQLVAELRKLTNITAISIGVPGSLNNKGVILRCGNLPWTNFDLKRALFQQFRCPIFIDNDARMASLAEINALSPVPIIGLYLTISTGIGGGLLVNGRLVGLNTEPGHMVLKFNDSWQKWEDFASGRAIRSHFGMFAKELDKPEQWQEVATRLTTGLVALIPALQPQVIVFGGSMGQFTNKFTPYLTEQLRRLIPDYVSIPALVKAKHPQEAVLYGCYYYAQHQTDVSIS